MAITPISLEQILAQKKKQQAQGADSLTGMGKTAGVLGGLAYKGGLFDALGGSPTTSVGGAYLPSIDAALAGPTVQNAAAISSTAPTVAPAATAVEGGFSPAIGTIGQGLAGAAGAYGAYNLLNQDDVSPGAGTLQGAAAGAGIGTSILPGVGTLVGTGVGALIGLAKGLSGSGKGEEQIARDKVREGLQGKGFVDQDWNVNLASGEKFDIGRDGGDPQYNVDFKREGIGQVVGAVNPLAEILVGGDDKLRSDFAGYLTNAAASSGDPLANIRKMYSDLGVDKEKAYQSIESLKSQGKVTEEEAVAYQNAVNVVFDETISELPKDQPKPQEQSRPLQKISQEDIPSETIALERGGFDAEEKKAWTRWLDRKRMQPQAE